MNRKLARIVFDCALLLACLVILIALPLRYLLKIFRSGKVNSLWAGTPIINMANNAKAERLLGVNAKSLVYTTYFITESFDYNLSNWTKIPLLGRIIPLFVFVLASLTVDRFHFYCDRGLLPPRGGHWEFDYVELYIYRMLSISVFFWTYGADIRNAKTCQEMGEPNCCTNCDKPGYYCVCNQQLAFYKILKLHSFSKAIFSGMGDMFGYTQGSIDNTFFWPVDLARDEGRYYHPVYPNKHPATPLRIVHASNHRRFKGTEHLINAVEVLQREGVDLELILVEKVPNNEAMSIYRSADVIFDQCLMGNYGYFALEGMALGKAVMCFIRKPDEYLLHSGECPIINTHIDTLIMDLRKIVQHRSDLNTIGRQGRQYIEKYFTLVAFAERLQNVYTRLGV